MHNYSERSCFFGECQNAQWQHSLKNVGISYKQLVHVTVSQVSFDNKYLRIYLSMLSFI